MHLAHSSSYGHKPASKVQTSAAEKQKLLDSLPIDVPTLKALLSYLDRNAVTPCDHRLRETVEFLQSRAIDPTKVVPWLQKHGGHCDCRVIYDLYDVVGDLVGWHLDEEADGKHE